MVLAEVAQVKINLCEAQAAGPPYPPGPGYDLDRYLNTALDEATCAEQAARSPWPKGATKKIGHVLHEFFSVWTGAEHETAVAAVHRAENLLLMITPESKLRSEALQMEAIFKSTNDITMNDPRHAIYTALFDKLQGRGCNCPPRPVGNGSGAGPVPITVDDRVQLRDIRREQNEAWEIARSRVRIFRNILTVTVPFLFGVLAVAAFWAWNDPGLLPLRRTPVRSDVAVVEFLGGLGGLLSAVATLRAARNYQRFYGLPLTQSLLKMPTGAASALAGVLLLQNGLLGVAASPDWSTVMTYALVFGVAQVAVTKQIDTRAGDLLGEANAKSPSTAQSTPAARTSADA